MNFIQDNHFTGEREVPDEEVLYRNHSEQSLVDGADAKWSKERALRRGEPIPGLTPLIVGLCSPE